MEELQYSFDPNSYFQEINDDFLQSLYEDNFTLSVNDIFLYIEQNLFEYLEDEKFITYCIFDVKESIFGKIRKNVNKNISNYKIPPIVHAIFCFEDELIILESIAVELIQRIISQLKNKNISIINVSQGSNSKIFTDDEKEAKEEINNFISNFEKHIRQSKFLYYTIRPVIGYLIRRNYYPTFYFINPTFFPSYESAFNPGILRRFEKILNSESFLHEIYNYIKLFKKLNEHIQNRSQFDLQEFQKNDFIKLRSLQNNFSLVFHKPTFYVYAMKTVENQKILKQELKHELHFNMNYSHRCLTKCYGFVKENDSIIGFLYEFMSNSTLSNFFNKHKEYDNKTFKKLIIIRIMQAIEYLHSNSLIHRDIKPQNILFDHDFLPYLSDFDKIREPNKEMTNDVGSCFYISPEQNYGKDVSFPTDIYSFGLVIYYLFEKKNLINNLWISFEDIQGKIQSISYSQKISNDFKDLILSCLNFYAFERPKIENVKNIINGFIDSFLYFEDFFIQKNYCENQLYYFLHEILFLYYSNNKLVQFFNNLYACNILYTKIQFTQIPSFSLFLIGHAYKTGFGVTINYAKTIEFYELFIQEYYYNDLIKSMAFLELGHHYLKGLGVIQNYSKAISYFEKSAQLNNPEALYNLGYFYKNGIGVKPDYSIAKRYYELSAQLNCSEAFLGLGNLYLEGLGVKQNYQFAKQYYEYAARYNNPKAYFNLGMLFENGWGVEQNYTTAKECYEFAANRNFPSALVSLGIYYEKGICVKKNYSLAKEYYERAANLNDSWGFLNLGVLYEYGLGVVKDHSKTLYLFEKSAEKNNPRAFYQLAIFYINKEPKDYLIAIKYLEKSAELNYFESFLLLGDIYLKGLGVNKNYLLAKKYFESCIKENNSGGFLNLGILYRYGLGVPKNKMKARHYFKLSAQLNHPLAHYILGSMYSNGELKVDVFKAIDYYIKCINIQNYCHMAKNKYFSNTSFILESNYFRYIAYNDLGLVYLFFFKRF